MRWAWLEKSSSSQHHCPHAPGAHLPPGGPSRGGPLCTSSPGCVNSPSHCITNLCVHVRGHAHTHTHAEACCCTRDFVWKNRKRKNQNLESKIWDKTSQVVYDVQMHLRNREKKSRNFLLKSVFQSEGPAQGHLRGPRRPPCVQGGTGLGTEADAEKSTRWRPSPGKWSQGFGPETDSGFNDDILEAK